ncbi:MAG: Ku protein [Propionibacteriales bacterium]|nr:Ku protein [Propionibacteriales bacterium]
MQAIWKGTISFGLVTIPVKVYSATEERDISFRQVHEADGGRIRYKRVCEVDGQEVPYSDIGKGYELPDGRMIILTSDDFASLPLPTARAIEVLEFVPADQVDPLYFAKAYYLAADGVGAKPYVLLRDALTGSGQCALVKVAIRTRETLALLRERDGALVLQTMLWPEEVRDSDFAVPDDSIEIRSQEVAMAESYIATLKTEFDPSRYQSDYREALESLVEAKASGLPMPEAEDDDRQQAEVLDLVAALRASVDAAKKRRETGSATAGSADGPAPAAARGGTRKAASTTSAAKRSTSRTTAKPASTTSTSSPETSAKATAKSAAKKPRATETAKPATKKRPAKKSA